MTSTPGNLARMAITADERFTFNPSVASRWRLVSEPWVVR
jgi:hypothetical protein